MRTAHELGSAFKWSNAMLINVRALVYVYQRRFLRTLQRESFNHKWTTRVNAERRCGVFKKGVPAGRREDVAAQQTQGEQPMPVGGNSVFT